MAGSPHRGHRALLAGCVMSGILLATAAPVNADVEKVRTGHCSGSATWRLEVERDRPDRAGTDTISFRATQLSNGQVCRGSLSI